jgi:hypothetical protein
LERGPTIDNQSRVWIISEQLKGFRLCDILSTSRWLLEDFQLVLCVQAQWHHVPSINDLLVGSGEVEGRNLVLCSSVEMKCKERSSRKY